MLLDGGATPSGLPYFVMEYVEGEPLLQYASSVPVHQRLELFRQICDAVQYAHDGQVVHRDIKPANILVTREGIPKLLDFGIAKLLDLSSEALTVTATAPGARLMTPAYASPEQISGAPVSPATDIYSLGAVLYELLTGKTAGRKPKCPSALVKDLDRDLDNVVAMAMRPEPERRYASARELSDDVGRVLRSLPVEGRKDSLAYRGRKFLTRQRRLLLTSAVATISILALVAVALFVYFGRAPILSKHIDRSGGYRE